MKKSLIALSLIASLVAGSAMAEPGLLTGAALLSPGSGVYDLGFTNKRDAKALAGRLGISENEIYSDGTNFDLSLLNLSSSARTRFDDESLKKWNVVDLGFKQKVDAVQFAKDHNINALVTQAQGGVWDLSIV